MTDISTIIVVFVTSFFVLLAIAGIIVKGWIPFCRERDFLKGEIKRTNGKERQYWKKELKKFYLKHIPIIGRFYE